MSQTEHYPIFRKYPNGASFFRIDSPRLFTELKLTPSFFSLEQIQATIHPDRLLISDMVEMRSGYWEPSSEEEFAERLAWCEKNLKSF
ncbi:MAG: hypothetical protein ACFB10_22090 [Salibacteraceae bacterium]